ncbi:MAG: hypothetical protein U0937_00670 [Thermodesulfovibrionia bacterium]|nr:hypothetical protein [Thermodesulfovibrionia bacterium]
MHEYIAGIIKGKEQKPIIVNGMAARHGLFIASRSALTVQIRI